MAASNRKNDAVANSLSLSSNDSSVQVIGAFASPSRSPLSPSSSESKSKLNVLENREMFPAIKSCEVRLKRLDRVQCISKHNRLVIPKLLAKNATSLNANVSVKSSLAAAAVETTTKKLFGEALAFYRQSKLDEARDGANLKLKRILAATDAHADEKMRQLVQSGMMSRVPTEPLPAMSPLDPDLKKKMNEVMELLKRSGNIEPDTRIISQTATSLPRPSSPPPIVRSTKNHLDSKKIRTETRPSRSSPNRGKNKKNHLTESSGRTGHQKTSSCRSSSEKRPSKSESSVKKKKKKVVEETAASSKKRPPSSGDRGDGQWRRIKLNPDFEREMWNISTKYKIPRKKVSPSLSSVAQGSRREEISRPPKKAKDLSASSLPRAAPVSASLAVVSNYSRRTVPFPSVACSQSRPALPSSINRTGQIKGYGLPTPKSVQTGSASGLPTASDGDDHSRSSSGESGRLDSASVDCPVPSLSSSLNSEEATGVSVETRRKGLEELSGKSNQKKLTLSSSASLSPSPPDNRAMSSAGTTCFGSSSMRDDAEELDGKFNQKRLTLLEYKKSSRFSKARIQDGSAPSSSISTTAPVAPSSTSQAGSINARTTSNLESDARDRRAATPTMSASTSPNSITPSSSAAPVPRDEQFHAAKGSGRLEAATDRPVSVLIPPANLEKATSDSASSGRKDAKELSRNIVEKKMNLEKLPKAYRVDDEAAKEEGEISDSDQSGHDRSSTTSRLSIVVDITNEDADAENNSDGVLTIDEDARASTVSPVVVIVDEVEKPPTCRDDEAASKTLPVRDDVMLDLTRENDSEEDDVIAIHVADVEFSDQEEEVDDAPKQPEQVEEMDEEELGVIASTSSLQPEMERILTSLKTKQLCFTVLEMGACSRSCSDRHQLDPEDVLNFYTLTRNSDSFSRSPSSRRHKNQEPVVSRLMRIVVSHADPLIVEEKQWEVLKLVGWALEDVAASALRFDERSKLHLNALTGILLRVYHPDGFAVRFRRGGISNEEFDLYLDNVRSLLNAGLEMQEDDFLLDKVVWSVNVELIRNGVVLDADTLMRILDVFLNANRVEYFVRLMAYSSQLPGFALNVRHHVSAAFQDFPDHLVEYVVAIAMSLDRDELVQLPPALMQRFVNRCQDKTLEKVTRNLMARLRFLALPGLHVMELVPSVDDSLDCTILAMVEKQRWTDVAKALCRQSLTEFGSYPSFLLSFFEAVRDDVHAFEKLTRSLLSVNGRLLPFQSLMLSQLAATFIVHHYHQDAMPVLHQATKLDQRPYDCCTFFKPETGNVVLTKLPSHRTLFACLCLWANHGCVQVAVRLIGNNSHKMKQFPTETRVVLKTVFDRLLERDHLDFTFDAMAIFEQYLAQDEMLVVECFNRTLHSLLRATQGHRNWHLIGQVMQFVNLHNTSLVEGRNFRGLVHLLQLHNDDARAMDFYREAVCRGVYPKRRIDLFEATIPVACNLTHCEIQVLMCVCFNDMLNVIKGDEITRIYREVEESRSPESFEKSDIRNYSFGISIVEHVQVSELPFVDVVNAMPNNHQSAKSRVSQVLLGFNPALQVGTSPPGRNVDYVISPLQLIRYLYKQLSASIVQAGFHKVL